MLYATVSHIREGPRNRVEAAVVSSSKELVARYCKWLSQSQSQRRITVYTEAEVDPFARQQPIDGEACRPRLARVRWVDAEAVANARIGDVHENTVHVIKSNFCQL